MLTHSAEQPLLDRVGKPMPWIYYQWALNLDAEGLALCVENLLAQLANFEGRQLAAYGLTSLPLVSACVLAGGGGYSGLAIRKEREAHGTRRQVEGSGDRSRPVVIVDDCIASGQSLFRAIEALEADGFFVEGVVALVNLPWKGGVEWAEGLGYRVSTAFDAWRDLERPIPDYSPSSRIDPPWRCGEPIKEGLSPGDVARHFVEAGLAGVPAPPPPVRFDRDYDGAGGVFVSIRKGTAYQRLARCGFFKDGDDVPLALDLARAAYAAGRQLTPQSIAEGGDLTVAATFLSAPRSTAISDMDFSRDAIVSRSTAQPWKVGHALPNTQFFTSEIEQLRHATKTNAKVGKHEPQRLSLHRVTRSVENGCSWPSFGSSDDLDQPKPLLCELVIARCRAIYRSLVSATDDVAAGPLPEIEAIRGLAVSIYDHGRLAGCWVAFGTDLAQLADKTTRGAVRDRRHAESPKGPDAVLLVSFLFEGEWIGRRSIGAVAQRLRRGRDTLVGGFGDTWVSMLAHVPCHKDWSADRMVRSTIAKANAPDLTPRWRTYKTHSFLCGDSVKSMAFGYPTKPAVTQQQAGALVGAYLSGQCDQRGVPDYCYWPTRDQVTVDGLLARKVLGLSALARAGQAFDRAEWRQRAERGTLALADTVLTAAPDDAIVSKKEVGGRLLLLELLTHCPADDAHNHAACELIRAELATLFHADGCISPLAFGMRLGTDHNILPGVALWAAARFPDLVERLDLAQIRSWYRRRFRHERSWGMTWWHMQAWTALFARTSDPDDAAFVFEIADWVLTHQLRKNGAFLVDYAPSGPSFHTGCVMEGLADAAALARSLGDARSEDYAAAFDAGHSFVATRLLITAEDLFCMPDPGKSLGGIRESEASSCVRIDYPAHYLLALAKMRRCRAIGPSVGELYSI